MIKADYLRLPRVDARPPNLVLMLIGKALAETYRDTMNQPLPEPLARIVREIESREARDGRARCPSPGAPPAGRPVMGRSRSHVRRP